eukprot:3877378-Karenia_brevis.AAC.1
MSLRAHKRGEIPINKSANFMPQPVQLHATEKSVLAETPRGIPFYCIPMHNLVTVMPCEKASSCQGA